MAVWGLAQRGARPRTRLISSVLLAVVCTLGLVVVLVRTPSARFDQAVDVSFPLTALSLAAGVVAGAARAVAHLPARAVGSEAPVPSRHWRWTAGPGLTAAVLFVAAVLAIAALPAWTSAANTRATTATTTPPQGDPPDLDGAVRWQSALPGQNREVESTAGGLAVAEWHATDWRLRMFDPASGGERWRYHRLGSRRVGLPVVSPDGRLLAVLASRRPPRRLWVTQFGPDTSVLVLDAVTGRVQADIPVPPADGILAVDRSGVVLDEVHCQRTLRRSSCAEGASGLAKLRLDGRPVWRHSSRSGCRPATALPVDGDLLISMRCTEPGQATRPAEPRYRHELTRVTGATGTPVWASPVDTASDEVRFSSVSLAAGVAVVSLFRPASEPATHLTVGLRLSDGEPAWRHESPRRGLPGGTRGERWARPLTANGLVVLAESIPEGTGAARSHTVRSEAVDAATGQPAWARDVPVGRHSSRCPAPTQSGTGAGRGSH